MTDVAKKAGVSQSTASFVLNNRQTELRISDATRQRVLDAARELGYRRNELARAVGTGKNFVLGFVKEEGTGELESRMLEGVLRTASDAGYLLKVLSRSHGDDDYQEVVRHCVEQRLAGLITRGFHRAKVTAALCEELGSHGIPIVFVDDNLTIPGTTCVTSDDDLGYRLTIEHLANLGHRDIAFLAGDSVHPQSTMRKEIYRTYMAEFGLPAPERSIVDTDWDLDLAERLTRQLFRDGGQRPTALICAGDALAAVAIRALAGLGLRVPHDVSVIGYSDFFFATLINPPLTTISQPFEEIGAVATTTLLQRLQAGDKQEDPASPILLPTKLVVRASTAIPLN